MFQLKGGDLSYTQLCEIYDEALKFIKKHPAVQQEKFKVHKLINKKPSASQNGSLKYYLKLVGTSQEPFIKQMVINDTLGALQWGRDKVQITKEFAQFIISKIPG